MFESVTKLQLFETINMAAVNRCHVCSSIIQSNITQHKRGQQCYIQQYVGWCWTMQHVWTEFNKFFLNFAKRLSLDKYMFCIWKLKTSRRNVRFGFAYYSMGSLCFIFILPSDQCCCGNQAKPCASIVSRLSWRE